jgi:chemotaxis protein methyltransferase CheR
MPTRAASAKARYLGIRDLARRFAGVEIGPDKDYLIETRLARLVSDLEQKDIAALDALLRNEPTPELERIVIEALLNGETTFFRDFDCYAALRNDVLPALIERRRAVKQLDFWSAACSTGQEPYSLAILVADQFRELADWRVRILATDLSHAHLERAAAGRYSQFDVNRGLPTTALIRHFDQDGADWVLQKSIRDRVELFAFNLIEDATPILRADVVLLRNVITVARHSGPNSGDASTAVNCNKTMMVLQYAHEIHYPVHQRDRAQGASQQIPADGRQRDAHHREGPERAGRAARPPSERGAVLARPDGERGAATAGHPGLGKARDLQARPARRHPGIAARGSRGSE